MLKREALILTPILKQANGLSLHSALCGDLWSFTSGMPVTDLYHKPTHSKENPGCSAQAVLD